MDWRLEVILERKDHIKVLETKLDTLQMNNLNVRESYYQERRFAQVDQAVLCRL